MSSGRTPYHPTIGIECHVQLKTATKLFSAVGNDARQAPPNTLISHICVGLPGALPVLNQKALELAVLAAFALNTAPQSFSKFDRKHYFYPDLPKGYQISQYDQPIITGGSVEIPINGGLSIPITRVHLEEDAGKTTHPAGADYSLVDLNRAGTPLLEIVSEPSLHSPEEAKAYARELYLIMKYAGISEADLYHGNIRFDVNVSLSNDQSKLGVRTEVKNLNSFRSVEAAVAYEIKRQSEVLERGGEVTQETRGWDEAKQKTTGQRSKEEAHDYRYMPEPDIPPIVLSEDFIAGIKEKLPAMMPSKWRQVLGGLNLEPALIETLLDIEVENPGVSYLGVVEAALEDQQKARAYANWVVNVEAPARRGGLMASIDDTTRHSVYKKVYEFLSADKISSTAAKKLLVDLQGLGHLPDDMEQYARDNGLLQESDEHELEQLVSAVVAENPKAAADVRNGEIKAIGFLVGQVMKKSRAQANPEVTKQIIKKQLGVEE